MRIQECEDGFQFFEEAGFKPPRDCQADMINRQIKFQRLIGTWDDRLKDYGTDPFCAPRTVLHHLDMAVQECSEAWDMLEGGWKGHKRHPDPVNRTELLMELVDVAHFLINAYVFMGGQAESEMVAKSVGRSKSHIALPSISLEDVWRFGEKGWAGNSKLFEVGYSYADVSHGEPWVKEAATRVNYLRSQIFKTADTIRYGYMNATPAARETFPAASGYVYIETMPWLYAAVQAVPGVTTETFYRAFVHKNDINFKRQERGY